MADIVLFLLTYGLRALLLWGTFFIFMGALNFEQDNKMNCPKRLLFRLNHPSYINAAYTAGVNHEIFVTFLII